MPHGIKTSGSILNLVEGCPMTIFLFFLFKILYRQNIILVFSDLQLKSDDFNH